MRERRIPVLAIVESGLQEINLPSLNRPAVPDDAPNDELVFWGNRYYVYCVIAHLRTILEGLSQLIKAGNIPTSYVVLRHAFEWAAHTCYMSRNLKTYIRKSEWRRARHLQSLAMEGNRWIKEHGPKYGATADVDDVPDPLRLGNIVSVYDEYQRQVYGSQDAKDSYGLLSEHSHPNSACFLPYCQFVGTQVLFVKPSADEAPLVGEERCLIDTLQFLNELLVLGQEKKVQHEVVAILKQIADLAIATSSNETGRTGDTQ